LSFPSPSSKWDGGVQLAPSSKFVIEYIYIITYMMIIFYSVWFGFYKKKLIKLKFKKKTKPVQTVWFCWTKTGSNRFGSVFRLGFGSVRFGFFGFRLIKPKPNRTGRFFQNFNWFNRYFFMVWFFRLFFLFSRFNRFFSFFVYVYLIQSNFQRFCGIDESTIVIFKNIFGLF